MRFVRPQHRFTRRQAVSMAAGGLGVSFVAACSPDEASSNPSTPRLVLVQRFASEVLVPGVVRLPVSLVADGTLQPTGPEVLAGEISDIDGGQARAVSAQRRSQGLTTAYWDFRTEIGAPGLYRLRVDGGDPDGAAFQVFDAGYVTMPHVGSMLPSLDTPTVDDHRGVEPYCSLTPEPCPFHSMTLADALLVDKPVIVVVGTPAFCSTGTCAPGLEFLIEVAAARTDEVSIVHIDVFADAAGTVVAPSVEALGLTYEPTVYLCAEGGRVVEQLDGIWDASELGEAIDRLTGQS